MLYSDKLTAEYKKCDNEYKKIGMGQIVLRIIIALLAAVCALPVLLIIVVAFSSEASIAENGFSYFPKEWSLSAFEYIVKFGDQIIRAYAVTVGETVIGSVLTVIITSMFAYVLSQKNFMLNRFLSKYVIFTTLFSGGLLGAYLINTNIYGLKNNFLVLVLPTCVTAWNTVVMRTFVRSNVPQSLVESASIDGAGEIYTFFKIVMPIMVPVIASIGFMPLRTGTNGRRHFYILMTQSFQPCSLFLSELKRI